MQYYKNNTGKAIWVIVIGAIVAAIVLFVGLILVFNDSPIIQSIKTVLENIWKWICGLFTSTPVQEVPNNGIV